MKTFNIYLCGVGGQGIGLLSEILLRAGDYAGHKAKAVDTHGLAQRGGIVISHLRFGDSIFSPMVPAKEADLVIALERHEAMRGADYALKDGGVLIYYDTVLQPLGVRLGQDKEVSNEDIKKHCADRNIRVVSVCRPDLADSRTQNIALLAKLHSEKILPFISENHLLQAMDDLMRGNMLKKNLEIFQR